MLWHHGDRRHLDSFTLQQLLLELHDEGMRVGVTPIRGWDYERQVFSALHPERSPRVWMIMELRRDIDAALEKHDPHGAHGPTFDDLAARWREKVVGPRFRRARARARGTLYT